MNFIFAEPPEPCVIRAKVAHGINDEKMLFTVLADILKFPDYFGMNWDALWECIRDLSWLPAGHVNLIHHDMPFIGDKEKMSLYLSLLNDAVKLWETGGSNLIYLYPLTEKDNVDNLIIHRKLFVSFPIEYKKLIDDL